jgi:glycosyltransferase involved in cell wall biosynthesis
MPVEEVLEHNVNGVLVPIDNEKALASQISLLLSNPDLRSSLGKAARSKALAYDISRTLPKIHSIISN